MLRLSLFLLAAAFTLPALAGPFTTEANIAYGEANGKPLLLDVLRPAEKTDALRPAIILVHGGGWVAGDKRDMQPMAEAAVKEGFVAFNINYRLVFGEQNRWPIPLDDTQRAVRWVRSQAEKYGIDPQRIGAIGASAGGHLVTYLGTTDTRDNSDPALAAFSSRVQCVVDIFGPTDLNEDFTKKVTSGLAVNDLVRQLIGGTPAEKPEAVKDASPLWRVDAKSAPFLIFHGRLDPLVPPDHSERLQAALQKAGVEAKLIMFEQEGHGFAKKESQATFATESLSFFQRHLKPASPAK